MTTGIDRTEVAELNRLMDEVEAELESGSEPTTEPNEEEVRYLAKKEAYDVASEITVPHSVTGMPVKTGGLPPLAPDASSADIAARIRI